MSSLNACTSMNVSCANQKMKLYVLSRSLCFSIAYPYLISQFLIYFSPSLSLSLALSLSVYCILCTYTFSVPQPHCSSYHSVAISVSFVQTNIGSLPPRDHTTSPIFSAKIFLTNKYNQIHMSIEISFQISINVGKRQKGCIIYTNINTIYTYIRIKKWQIIGEHVKDCSRK